MVILRTDSNQMVAPSFVDQQPQIATNAFPPSVAVAFELERSVEPGYGDLAIADLLRSVAEYLEQC